MKGLRCWWLLGCLGAVLFGAPSAHAADGQITFAGAVVEPTCSLGDAGVSSAALLPIPGSSPHRFACGGSTEAPADAGRAYALTEVGLDTAAIANDRVLAYFASYLNAAGITGAKLVTQTYE